jgi:hypothetical protein
MVFEVPRIVLADRPAARRLARLVDALAAPGDQIMPVRQRVSVRPQPIGTGFRKPIKRAEIAPVEGHAIGDQRLAVLVILAAAVAAVEQLAGDVGRVEDSRLLVLELVDAAPAAAVAQGFPLAAVELGQRPLPERRLRVG